MRHELKRDMRYHYVCDIIDEADSGHLGSVWVGGSLGAPESGQRTASSAGKWIAWNALKENILDQGGLEPTISGLRALRSTDLS